jgi:hypothetical protein
MRSLRKVVAISWFLLSLAASCIPVYASPTKKDVTLDCGSVSPDVVVGNAIVTLCPSSGSSGVCALGQTSVVCPAVSCDSSGTTAPVSMTVSCAAGFKVAGLTSNMSFVEYDGNGNQVNTGGSSPSSTLNGKGFSTTAGNSTGTVTLTVK